MRAPGIPGLGNPQFGESLVAAWITFIHRQHALVAGDQRSRSVGKLLHPQFMPTDRPVFVGAGGGRSGRLMTFDNGIPLSVMPHATAANLCAA